MLTSIIIAVPLGPADFGTYILVIGLVATGVVITKAGVSSAVIKFVAELPGAGRDGQIRSLLPWAWRVQATFMTVVLVGGTMMFILLGARLIPDFNHGVLLAILLATTERRSLNIPTIGRASCRARVGRYGKISRFSDSLKKKKKH